MLVLLDSLSATTDTRRSTYDDMSRDIRAMQDDDMANPASLWVNDGAALWSQPAGAAQMSCADCHGDAATSMKGVAARYPVFDAARGKPVGLEARINHCRKTRQQAPAFAPESRDLLALTAFVGRQSRGLPITTGDDPRLAPFVEAGRMIFERRQGQLNLSCAICHDHNAGKRLASALIPQAHPTGYPIYRLEWQSLGSLARRLRNCMAGMRAAPYATGSDEIVALELFLMARARGMATETPAVRP
ncbi:sulfur oxidation c-type cytochrome SoxA [Xanthobacteraceae bacterium Astr-EGSB]|uniref:sulfur oxidation c-type cytochrome SoxA n=1 Tax=Astrobacterium formosum TaxID=3069710 RepID=UPI0027B718E1|nr:sulfur oxidation c-type cytochrome SoxA [Xanthobacteraceae bacterium Astr-EGSB]